MSDFFRPAEHPVARRQHRCVGCYGPIVAGEQYHRQTGVYDGRWFVNKLHSECADALAEEASYGWYEFTPGELDPPERMRAASTPQPADAAGAGPTT